MSGKSVRSAFLGVAVLFSVLLLLTQAWSLGVASAQAEQPVVVAPITGVINTITQEYIQRVIDNATEDGARAIVFRLNTPGGELDATRRIVEAFYQSPLPIIVYISPSGARAGSAGVFITYGAHLAAMAPGTNIGAASPVGLGVELTGTLEVKVTNDAAALIRSAADRRGRNAQWAEQAVREAVSVTDREALELNVVNFIATDVPDLLTQADGHEVSLPQGKVTLQTRGAPIVETEMNIFEQFFQFLLDPNVALILLNIGTLAILVELYNPGATIPAIVGVICLTLAAVALFSLPTNWAAVFLIVAAFGMLILDIKVSGFALTVGGIIAFVLGASLLFRPLRAPSPTAPVLEVSPVVIGLTALLTAGFFLVAVSAAWRSRRLPVVTGTAPLIGATGVAITRLAPLGTVLVKSEEWTALAEQGAIEKGEQVKVVTVDGLRLIVARVPGAPKIEPLT